MAIQDVGTIAAWTPARLTRYIQNEFNQRAQIAKTVTSADQAFVHQALTFSSGDMKTADTILARPSTGVLTINGIPIVTGSGGGGGVTSVFGRTGIVVATTGDYTAAQVTNAADLSSASAQIFTGEVGSTAGLWTNDVVWTERAGATNLALAAYVTGDADDRFEVLANGQINWGPGNAATDTSFYRDATNSLHMSGALTTDGGTKAAWFWPTGLLPSVNGFSAYVGATSSGAPGSGSFSTGHWIIDVTGQIWICTTSGTPGTWTAVGATGNKVTSVFSRTGAIVATSGDYSVGQITGAAPLASPTFTGTPTAPTAATADNSTTLATTAFVKAQAYAPLASPTFTGTPAAPTPTASDSSTKIATTAFVKTQPHTRTIKTTGSGTYNPPLSLGCVAILVECIGGGGGGGGAIVGTSGQVAVGGGGGGGAYSSKLITSPASSYAYSVGAGGTAGGNPGGTGGDTTFGTTIVVAKGGVGGVGMAASGAAPQYSNGGAGGASASGTGDIVADGGAGGVGMAPVASGTSVGGGGGGGAPVYGSPGKMQASNAVNGIAGQNYGGGGSGAVRTASTGTQTGGVGATGIIVITEYYV